MKSSTRKLVVPLLVISALGLSACGAAGAGSQPGSTTTASADPNWSTEAVSVDAGGSTSSFTYEPIPVDQVKKDMTVCVLFPNMADDYWASANYGSLVEAQRDKVNYLAYNAGGYEHLQAQLDQIDGCITQHVSAIMIAAISEGACSGVKKALDAGIPVVDFINGLNCPGLEDNPQLAHVSIGPADYGASAADLLIEQDKQLNVALFPGPDGTSFVEAVSKAFKDRLNGSKVTVAVDKRGPLTEDSQLSLAEDVLRTYPQVDATIGNTVGGTAAVTAIRNAGKQDTVEAYQYAITKSFYQHILDGTAVGAVSDVAPLSSRMAFDQAVRLASNVDPTTSNRIGPQAKLVTEDTIKEIPFDEMFAPDGFQLTYNWTAGN